MKRFLTLFIIVLLATAAWSAKTAQAIWTAGNTTLTFTYEEPVSVGSTYNGKKVTNVWSGRAVTATGDNLPGWNETVKGSVTKVVFNSSFKNVQPAKCRYWFCDCEKLTTITGISYLITTDVTSMDGMFRGCSSLPSLNLSSFNTSNVTSMSEMFNGCSSLTSLNLSSFNTTNVTSMSLMFSCCSSLTSLNLSSFNTTNVTYMSDMFAYCSSLTSLDLSSFNTAKVIGMSDMFSGCSSLTSLNLSSFNTKNVTSMFNMFHGCSSLTSLDLSSFNTANVSIMGMMFYGCSSLTSLDLSSFNTTNLTYTSLMFSGCSGLTSLDLSSFNTSSVDTSESMFSDVPAQCFVYMPTGVKDDIKSQRSKNLVLKSGSTWTCASCEMNVNTDYAVLYKFTASSLTVNGASSTTFHLYNNGKLYSKVGTTNVVIPAGKDKFVDVTAQAIWTEGNKTLSFYYGEAVSVGGTYGGKTVTKVWKGTAVTATRTSTPSWVSTVKGTMTTVKFDASFKNVKPTSCYGWFFDCSKLTTISDISNLITANVTNMDYMFYECSSLTSLNLSSFNTANVTKMWYMFCGCSSLTSLDLGSFNTANVTHMSEMFYGCSSLTSLDLSSFNTTNVTYMQYMFYGCSSLTSLNLSSFNTAKVTDMMLMFYNCASLKNLDLSSFNTSSITSCSGMFSSVPAQCFVYMPTGVTDDIKSQRSKNLVLKNSSTWTCANCEMTPDTEYDIWYQFKATALSVAGSSVTAYCLYKDGAMYSTLTNLANVTIPKGKDKVSETFPAMAIWTAGNTTLTFLVSDSYKAGDTYNNQTITNVWKGSTVTASATTPAWLETVQGTMTKVVFASSFKYVKPTTCRSWFYQCGKLATITGIGNLNTSEVISMRQMFRECTSLTSLNLSTFDTQKVISMRTMFYGCTGLTSLNISNFSTVSASNIGYMFYNCKKLTSIDVSKFNTDKVTAMDGVFYNCAALTSLDVTNFNTQKVTTMESMFRGCSKLTSIDASNFSYDALTTYTDMFTSVPELCFVYMSDGMPDGLKSLKPKNLVLRASTTSSTYTCANCEMKVNTVYNVLHKFTATKLTVQGSDATSHLLYNNGEYYSGALSANTVFPEGSDKLVVPTTKAIWTADNNTLTFMDSNTIYKVGDSYNGQTVTNVWYGAEVTATSGTEAGLDAPGWQEIVSPTLTNVVFASSFKNVKPKSFGKWFQNCSKLTTFTGMENLVTTDCVNMSYMFDGCSSLTSLDLSHFNTANVFRFLYVFRNCSSLKSLDLSTFSNATMCEWGTRIEGVFYGCSSLEYIDISNFNSHRIARRNDEFFKDVPLSCFVYAKKNYWSTFSFLASQHPVNAVLKDEAGDGSWACTKCVFYDGTSVTIPRGFTATGGVKYERNIAANNGNGYTVFLPYDCPIPEGVTAYTLRTDEQSLLGEDKIVFAPIEGDVLEAYNPYLLVNSGNDLTNLNTTVDTQVLPTTTATAEKEFGDMRFTGTMRTISNEEAAGMGAYIMQTGCRWKKVMTSSPSAYIPAYRAYLISPSGEAQTRATLFDGTTVGIDPVAASGKMLAGDDNIYDLQGRCVATKGQWSVANGQLSIATGKLPQGVYITNGHRYVVK